MPPSLIQGEWSNKNYFIQWCLPDTAEGALYGFALCFEIIHLDQHTNTESNYFFKHASNTEILLAVTGIPLYTNC